MRYSDSLRYLSRFLNLEQITFQPDNRLWNLERMKILLEWFGHPEKDFFSVIIAGTKGKGSSGFFLESILLESGIPVGFYHSPHLEEPTERIRLNGRSISRRLWGKGLDQIRRVLNRRKIPLRLGPPQRGRTRRAGQPFAVPSRLGEFTYFEILTLLAILTFKSQGIRTGIFEVGMGGRLDATNALRAPLAILTPISLDHEAILGSTVQKIAGEKAAVIHPRAQVVVGPQKKEALEVIRRRAVKVKARMWYAFPVPPMSFPNAVVGNPDSGSPLKTCGDDMKKVNGQLRIGLKGDYQESNAEMAAEAARVLRSSFGFPISNTAIYKGLRHTGWPGRWELFGKGPLFLLDGAHNPASVQALVRNLKKMYPRRKRGLSPFSETILIFGVSRDKRSREMLQILSGYFTTVILTSGFSPRAKEMETLLVEARDLFPRIFPAAGVQDALRLARGFAAKKGLVVATGSFYLIGEMRRLLGDLSH